MYNDLPLFLSPEYPCSYLPGRTARSVFVDPHAARDNHRYGILIREGFRRSGPYFYRPECPGCRACVPLRVAVREFRPDRSQRRTWKRNQDLDIRVRAAQFVSKHFALYSHYLAWRHPGGGMDQSSPNDYANFLLDPGGGTFFAEMSLQGKLAAVAVVDALDNALSAVYTFYAPELARRSLGTFAILWEIREARCRGLEWLYLGYRVAASRKMAYKDRFRPCELLGADGWQRIPANAV